MPIQLGLLVTLWRIANLLDSSSAASITWTMTATEYSLIKRGLMFPTLMNGKTDLRDYRVTRKLGG